MAEKRPSLNVLSGPLAGQKFVLEDAVDNILIGSDSSCGFVLDTPGVSPIHARLWVDLDGATIYDTNSPFGVYVNDDRVVREAPVRNGDILWLGPPGAEGSVLIQCILPSTGPAAEPPAPAARPESPPVEDTSRTMAFEVPAFLADEPELAGPPPLPDARGVDATVVMPSASLVDDAEPDLPEPEPTVALPADDPSALVDDLAGLEVFDETAIAPPPPVATAPAVENSLPVASAPPMETAPVEDMGFPDFDVEPTVATPPPPPVPPKAAAPPEFEEDIGETVVDVPSATIVTHAVGASTSPAPPPEPIEEEEPAATVMYHRTDAPAPAAAAPAPRAATPPAPVPTAAPSPRPSLPPPPAAAPVVATPAVAPRPPASVRAPAEARPASSKPPAAPAPGDAPARTATPAPRARPERPETGAPPPAATARGGGRGALIAASAVVIAALAFAAYWFLRPTAGPAPAAEPSPAAAAVPSEATPPPALAAAEPAAAVTLPPAPIAAPISIPESVSVVRSPVPSPRVAAVAPGLPPNVPGQRPGAAVPARQRPPTAAPAAPTPNPAQQTAAAVTNLMAQAQAASAARNYDAAISIYDEVLKLQPQNAAATSARNAAVAARTAGRRAFVPGRTVVQTEKAKGGGDIAGFDSSDVSVKKAPDFQGRLEFAMNPPTVKPGDRYRLQVALVNEGKKPIKLSGMTFTITVNGKKSGNPIAPRVKEVAPQQRVVLEELPGVFPEASSWVAEVLVTANKGDSLKNQLTWK